MKISTILDHIDSGPIALPEFQRGYVWNRDQVRGLFDSLAAVVRSPKMDLLVINVPMSSAISDTPKAVVHCKPYHRALKVSAPGNLRGIADRKSECPGWLGDEQLRQKLLNEALDDPKGETDFLGRPKKKWNAINGVYLIGVSTNEPDPKYNCYPEHPTCLLDELSRRVGRSLEEFINQS